MTSPWWAAFGPAEAQVSCGQALHRLRWADGSLQPVDHPDADAELLRTTPGGATTGCLDLCRAWAEHAADLSVLALAPRSDDDQLSITSHLLAEGRQGLLFARSGEDDGSEGRNPRLELIELLALGEAFQLRLAGTVAHAWSAEGAHGQHSGQSHPALAAALTSRLAPAAARWLDLNPGQVNAAVHSGTGWGEVSLDHTATRQRLRARLPVSWLASMWAPGLTVVGGHLMVGIQQASWPTAHVLALRRPGSEPVELAIRHDGQAWTLAG
ncbi:MAG TPA: hypothetical protein VGI58_20115 [Streptosporangiaceae bacterium]